MNRKIGQQELIGIVGGMGPLASTAFLSTLYELTVGEIEQQAGRFILYSDPVIPDRTEAFLAQRDDIIIAPFIHILQNLNKLHVRRIIVCCITLHHILPRLPEDLRVMIVSLLDVILSTVQQKQERQLLLCTNATLQLRLFQRHPLWEECADAIVLPCEQDQQTIHSLIYHLKAGGNVSLVAAKVQELLYKYGATSFIAGCTEFHLLSRYLEAFYGDQPPFGGIDPLMTIAQELTRKGRTL